MSRIYITASTGFEMSIGGKVVYKDDTIYTFDPPLDINDIEQIKQSFKPYLQTIPMLVSEKDIKGGKGDVHKPTFIDYISPSNKLLDKQPT